VPTKKGQHIELEDTAARIAAYALEVASTFECASELSDSYYNMDEYEQANFVQENAESIEVAAGYVLSLLAAWTREHITTA